jgi:hypothetical protein
MSRWVAQFGVSLLEPCDLAARLESGVAGTPTEIFFGFGTFARLMVTNGPNPPISTRSATSRMRPVSASTGEAGQDMGLGLGVLTTGTASSNLPRVAPIATSRRWAIDVSWTRSLRPKSAEASRSRSRRSSD